MAAVNSDNFLHLYNLAEGDLSRCQTCGGELALHQPDEELPDRLIATCPDCKGWYLADAVLGRLEPIAGTSRADEPAA